jgi:hypothetical protein
MRSLIFAAIVLVTVPFASAQVQPVAPEFQVNTYSTSTQNNPHLASDASGAFVATWQSWLQDGDGMGIFARRYDAAGAPLGPEFRVNTYTTGHQEFRPAVASDAAGNFTIVWASRKVPTSQDYEVKGQRFDVSGIPVAGEFLVNSTNRGMDYQPSIASDAAGNVVVVWSTLTPTPGVYGRRYGATGVPLGPDFQVDGPPTRSPELPEVALDPSGGFLVAWHDNGINGAGNGVFVRAYDGGQGTGSELSANSCPTAGRFRAGLAALGGGKFVVAWPRSGYQTDIEAQVFGPRGTPLGPEISVGTGSVVAWPIVVSDGPDRFAVLWQGTNMTSLGRGFNADGVAITAPFPIPLGTTPSGAARQAAGRFVTAWTGFDADLNGVMAQQFRGLGTVLEPHDLVVDPNGNGVFESGETVSLVPGWKNPTAAPISASGSATGFTGPSGATYTILDGTAQYAIAAGQRGDCAASGDCYSLSITAPSRPVPHWDATMGEALSSGVGIPWSLHVGDSFADVPRARGFYRFVETLLHRGVTAGCSTGSYCPDSPVTRQEMAVFLRVAREGSTACAPGACVAGAEMFGDVPASSPYCRWIEELARFGVATGCGSGLFCPQAPVTREAMAVFALAAREGPGYAPPPCTSGAETFTDVPASSVFCRWIEELARRNVVSGCGGGRYCPTTPVTRGEMSVFMSVTFGLSLYGP